MSFRIDESGELQWHTCQIKRNPKMTYSLTNDFLLGICWLKIKYNYRHRFCKKKAPY